MDKSLANSIRHDPAQYLLAGRTENNRHMHSYTQKNIALIAIFPSIIIISSSIIEQVWFIWHRLNSYKTTLQCHD